LVLFAHGSIDLEATRANYNRFIDRGVKRLKSGIAGDWLLPNAPTPALIPDTDLGDSHFVSSYAAYTQAASHTKVNVDVTALANVILPRIAAGLTLNDLRGAGRIKGLGKKRNELIAALIQAGCRTAAIARCLRVSQSHVSN